MHSRNFRLVFKIKEAISDLFNVTHYYNRELRPTDDFDLIIVSKNGKIPRNINNLLVLRDHMSQLKIRSEIISAMNSKNSIDECIVGIDPGYNIGISLIYQLTLVDSTVVYSIEKLILWIKNRISQISYKQLIIRVGDGGHNVLASIIDRLIKEFSRSAQIELVDEKNTSTRINSSRSIHVDAAIKIARRKGEIIN